MHFYAPAKLNLCLRVGVTYAIGLHKLESVYTFLRLYDTLDIVPTTDGKISFNTSVLASVKLDCAPADNLAYRAANLLRDFAQKPELGAKILLVKRIPSGAGLGGGSSDAAAVLLALNELWGLHYPKSVLLELARKLGDDVSLFVGGESIFTDIKGKSWPIWVPEIPYLLIHPQVSFSTAEVFARFDALAQQNSAVADVGSNANSSIDYTPMRQDPTLVYTITSYEASYFDSMRPRRNDGGNGGGNDLQIVVPKLCHPLKELMNALSERCLNEGFIAAPFLMTGTGSTYFAPVANVAKARAFIFNPPHHETDLGCAMPYRCQIVYSSQKSALSDQMHALEASR